MLWRACRRQGTVRSEISSDNDAEACGSIVGDSSKIISCPGFKATLVNGAFVIREREKKELVFTEQLLHKP